MSLPRPCSAASAVSRARSLLGNPTNATTGYWLGTGDYHPTPPDLPWTGRAGAMGSDCAGLIVWCFEIPRRRPGYNRGNPCGVVNYDVEDDCNSNSFLGDSLGARDLFEPADGDPQPGDVLAYPTFRLPAADDPSRTLTFIGHVALVIDVSQWDGESYESLRIAQICGPNGRMPACIESSGQHFDDYRKEWPKLEQTVRLLRVVP